MSTTSPSYMTREKLSSIVKESPDSVVIIDVRDDDYIGGHIRGSRNVPSTTLDYRIPELVRTLKGKEMVVFHCALSQQRGPAAARRYSEQVEKRLRTEGASTGAAGATQGEGDDGKSTTQQVFVLDGGFVKWQEKYGTDPDLTEDYAKDIWEFGY